MATRSTNTMAEGLQSIMQEITSLKATPDADVAFLIGLETTILQKLREPYDQMAGQMGGAAPGNSVAMGAQDATAGVDLSSLGNSLMAQGGAALGNGIMPGGAAGSPGPGSPLPSLASMQGNPHAIRQALRPSIQGG